MPQQARVSEPRRGDPTSKLRALIVGGKLTPNGAGIFFLAYLLFEVPSNFLMEKVGARRWLARIMISCGIVGGSMVLVSGPKSFYILRFILGAVEAGLFPGVILYLTYWFPKRYRARYVGTFALGIPLASVIGSPVSGLLLTLDGVLGFKAGSGSMSSRRFPRLSSAC